MSIKAVLFVRSRLGCDLTFAVTALRTAESLAGQPNAKIEGPNGKLLSIGEILAARWGGEL